MTTNTALTARRKARVRTRFAAGAAGLAVAVCAVGMAAPARAASPTSPATPADRAQQWYLSPSEASSIWAVSRGAGVTVAIVDSGVDATQPDIAGALLPEIDFSTGSPVPGTGDVSATDDGTAAAILIVGSGLDSSGIQGLAPKAKILPIRYFKDKNSTPTPAYAAAAIRYAVDHGARVIVMPSPAPSDAQSLTNAVQYAISKNAVVITSTANNGLGTNELTAPCTISGVVCVSGTTREGTIWPESSNGPQVTLAAPAENLPVWTETGYGIHSSTHYSAALVAAEAALVISAHPSWSEGQVVQVMIDTVSGGNAAHTRVNNDIGYGIINPLAAVTAASPAATTNPLTSAAPKPSVPAAPPAAGKSSGSGSSGPWLLIGIVVVAVLLIGGLGFFLVRRRGNRGNYLTDPGYQAGPNYSPSLASAAGQYQYSAPGNPPAQFPPSQYPYSAPDGSAPQYADTSQYPDSFSRPPAQNPPPAPPQQAMFGFPAYSELPTGSQMPPSPPQPYQPPQPLQQQVPLQQTQPLPPPQSFQAPVAEPPTFIPPQPENPIWGVDSGRAPYSPGVPGRTEDAEGETEQK